jgi:cardiolipin synthase A/B
MTPALFWRIDLLIALHVVVALWTAVHAVMHKHEPRAAWAWITACWLFPFFGALLYFWFGINRIQRRARRRLGAAAPREWQNEPM